MSVSAEALLDYPVATPPPPGTVVRIAPSILWLRMPLPFALDHVNLWLVEGADGWTLIDTGYGDAPTRELWERHFTDSLGGLPIVRIVATHCHPDHLGNAAWLAQRFGAAVTMTLSEFLTAHAICDERAGHARADTGELFRRHGMSDTDLAALAARGNHYRNGVPTLPTTLERIQHDDVVGAGNLDFRVITGYGHSNEHASLHAAAAGVLVSGDMLLPRISTNVSVWPSDPNGDPLGRFLHSIDAFTALPATTLVLPSHGLPFRGIATRVAQLRAHHDARLAELVAAIDSAPVPMSTADVVPILFRRALDVHQRFFAMGEALAHLNHLWRHGRIRRLRSAAGTYRFARTDAT
ncbi:MAG: MBL fold metallo-hydrolase [Burkholderiales bacterium]|nr:MBL fold metallo-hydrolase [Burkholderiales bacterium]